MPWTLSAFTDEAGDTCEQQIAACRRGGFTHLDLRSVDGYNITELPMAQAKQIRAKLDAAGLTVHMFGSPIGKIDISDDFQIDADRMAHLGEMAKVFDCPGVRLFSYYNRTGWTNKKWQEASIARLEQLRDLAGGLGLVAYHENEADIFGDHPEDVAAIVELRDGAVFKLIYDFGNYVTVGADNWATWRMFKDKTDVLHFKDRKADGEHMPLGEGDGEVREILSDAVASGWQGPCVLEPHLRHSAAVLATGPSGTGNQAYAKMPLDESFQVAVAGAKKLMAEIGAAWA